MKRFRRKLSKMSLFSESSLVLIVSVVTFLLQLISFATTWNGSKIYLEGIFPYASLLFAVAVQATAYFFSNSLRTKASFLKVLALCIALCCSTYYSYIGIYNSVNSPVTYLQERYVSITRSLNEIYDEELEHTLADTQETINDAASMIISEYTALTGVQQNITACRTALDNVEVSYTSNMRAPSRYSYENYEDYAVAYEAYISSISQSNNVENEAARSLVLSTYGFRSMEDLIQTEQQNIADLSALHTALGNTDVTNIVSGISLQLSKAITNAGQGIAFTAQDTASLNSLLQAAKLCGYPTGQLSQLTNALNQCAQASSEPLMKDYNDLVASLEGGTVTDANTMLLKSMMDAEILSALLKNNSLLTDDKQISLTDPAYEITDLYLIPIRSLQNTETKMIALFCLMVAALVDALSVLFALSIRKRKPLWKRHLLSLCRMEDYETMIYASLPEVTTPAKALSEFLGYFRPSPTTESDGYMLKSDLNSLQNYHALTALLCQVNLAKIIPAGFWENDTDILLLKARFVFWTNNIIYEERKEAMYE